MRWCDSGEVGGAEKVSEAKRRNRELGTVMELSSDTGGVGSKLIRGD